MHKLKLTLLTFFLINNLFGQRIEKVFLDKNDSTGSFYTIIYPPDTPWKGYLIMIPGFGQSPEMVFQQTDLPMMAAEKGLLTIIPTLQDGILSFGVDIDSQASLEKIIQDVKMSKQLIDLPFFIGGFSIGGSCAIKYAQESAIKPSAVFGIDPPLDFERFYNSSKRDIRLSINIEPSQENIYMVDRIEKEFGGTPETALSNFYKISPYSYSDITQTAVKKIGNLPIRIYSEPDMNWWLKERNFDVTNINVVDCSAMINELKRLGNDQAQLILTENKGYRKPYDIKHPHSWSIVDNEELLDWLLNQIINYE